jgi:erythromycin esterase
MKPWEFKKTGNEMKRCSKNFVFVMTMILFLSFWACKKINEDVPQPDDKFDRNLLQSLNQAASPLTGADSTLPDTELAPLADLGQALVVGLGEATHGTHEFFAMKHRLFRYLVERFDFRVFAFECDYGESIYFDRWLNGEAGDLDNLMKTYMQFWTWRTIEVKALLNWMRQTNHARPETKRLHYIGVDCQFATYQPDLLREYLKRVSPQHLTEIEPLLVQEEKFRDGDFANLSAEHCSRNWSLSTRPGRA